MPSITPIIAALITATPTVLAGTNNSRSQVAGIVTALSHSINLYYQSTVLLLLPMVAI